MKKQIVKKIFFAITISVISFSICAFTKSKQTNYTISYNTSSLNFPYKSAGLTQQQAAAHLLNRFTFGATQKQIDAAIAMGLENWFVQQCSTTQADALVNEKLGAYDALKLSNQQIVNTYPKGAQIKKMAIDEGFTTEEKLKTIDKKEIKNLYDEFRTKKGLKPEQELYRQLINQKIIRALYSNNQVQEVLTDFWFNHFNVSMTKNICQQLVPVYERDAIRPNILGNFENLVLATAKSPAMLTYLDNFTSMGVNDKLENLKKLKAARQGNNADTANNKKKKVQGLNENYAREVMELHTLGVDGGYTQQDVTEAARILTGWTINPMGAFGKFNDAKKMLDKFDDAQKERLGFVQEGDFLFVPTRHDNGSKTVLGTTYIDNGYNEGVQLLKTLANHKSTASFICKKIATRFINDNPSANIISKMAATFLSTSGNIKEVIFTMVQQKEFWEKTTVREKTKSPFEYAMSSLRLLNANVTQPYQIYNWITKMGQQIYFYQAPTGFPDKAQYWINTGSLLNRMNFGLAIASKRIPGVQFDLAAINNNHEPESAEAALQQYAKLLLPQRDITTTIKRLTPLINDPTITNKINNAAVQKENTEIGIDDGAMENQNMMQKKEKIKTKFSDAITNTNGDNSMLSQVVGIIIGSPEFQRK